SERRLCSTSRLSAPRWRSSSAESAKVSAPSEAVRGEGFSVAGMKRGSVGIHYLDDFLRIGSLGPSHDFQLVSLSKFDGVLQTHRVGRTGLASQKNSIKGQTSSTVRCPVKGIRLPVEGLSGVKRRRFERPKSRPARVKESAVVRSLLRSTRRREMGRDRPETSPRDPRAKSPRWSLRRSRTRMPTSFANSIDSGTNFRLGPLRPRVE